MKLKYRVKTKPDNIGKRDTPKYYAVPVQRGIVDIKFLSERLADKSSLSRGDVCAVVIGLTSLIEDWLHKGYAVKLNELGVFSLSVSSEGFDTPEECLPHLVKAKKICFRADSQLKKQLKNVKFERDTTG